MLHTLTSPLVAAGIGSFTVVVYGAHWAHTGSGGNATFYKLLLLTVASCALIARDRGVL